MINGIPLALGWKSVLGILVVGYLINKYSFMIIGFRRLHDWYEK